jgi:hypothetical protein
MRIFVIAAAGLMLASMSASACEYSAVQASVPAVMTPIAAAETPTADDLSAAKKKEKVEYMKSAAGPEPKVTKKKKK